MPTEKKTWIWKLDPKILNEVDKYVLVKKEDLEKLIREYIDHDFRGKMEEKYLEEDKP